MAGCQGSQQPNSSNCAGAGISERGDGCSKSSDGGRSSSASSVEGYAGPSSQSVGHLGALLILWRHRSVNNYKSLDFVGSRTADKVRTRLGGKVGGYGVGEVAGPDSQRLVWLE